MMMMMMMMMIIMTNVVAFTGYMVVKMLKRLAEEGRTVGKSKIL
jgi:hypothetical protein